MEEPVLSGSVNTFTSSPSCAGTCTPIERLLIDYGTCTVSTPHLHQRLF
jgi:hypothetical protein